MLASLTWSVLLDPVRSSSPPPLCPRRFAVGRCPRPTVCDAAGMATARPDPAPVSPRPVTPEPVSPDPPGAPMRPLLTQSWLDLAFLHWAVDPVDVAPLLPPGTVPDTFDGTTTYVGLVAFRMYRVGGLGLPGIPYLGTFPETNVRLYSVDEHGRPRGRLPVPRRLAARPRARGAGRVPVAVRVVPDGRRAVRRHPHVHEHPPLARSSRCAEQDRAAGGGHDRGADAAGALPHRPVGAAQLVLRTDRVSAERPPPLAPAPGGAPGVRRGPGGGRGLPAPVGEPMSVLYSPGVPVRFGPQRRPRAGG